MAENLKKDSSAVKALNKIDEIIRFDKQML
jgi:hypothetical protein